MACQLFIAVGHAICCLEVFQLEVRFLLNDQKFFREFC
jgi:hypothetical protein